MGQKDTPMKGMLVVSHNIEEAVLMADRVLTFASDPGKIRDELLIAKVRPRDADSPEVRYLIDQVYAMMTTKVPNSGRVMVDKQLGYRLPDADTNRMEGLIDLLAESPFNGRADLPKVAEETELTDDGAALDRSFTTTWFGECFAWRYCYFSTRSSLCTSL